MTPNELYALESHSVTNDLYYLDGHLPELAGIDLTNASISNTQYVVIRIVKEIIQDHSRYWRLATVWFRGNPVMVIQNAGRGGRDHMERFITDPVEYMKMCVHLVEFAGTDAIDEDTIIDANSDDPNLTSFYCDELNE